MPDDKLFTMQMSTLESNGPPKTEFLEAVLSAFKAKDGKRDFMLTAQRYYQNDNDINERKRIYIDENGNEQEALLLSNKKLAHSFLRKLTNQKVRYLLSKIWTVSSDDQAFLDLLNATFDKNFHRLIKNVGKDAIINGIGWIQVYYSQAGKLSFKRIPSDQVVPFWRDVDHTVLAALLRFYEVINYTVDGEEEVVTKMEYHTTEGIWYFIQDEDGIREDADQGFSGNYDEITLNDNGEDLLDENGDPIKRSKVWGKIPFIPFKYTFDEIPLLQLIYSKTDDYDLTTSDTANHIADIPNSTKVVKDYDGNPDERAAFTKNVATYGTIYVRGSGDVKTISTPFDIATVNGHLDRLRKDIYDFGNGVDMQNIEIGNRSGVAMKFIFADLDMDCDDMANEFQLGFENLVWFIKEDAILNGLGDFTESEFEIVFNKGTYADELEAMQIIEKAQGIPGISRETIVGQVPFVTKADEEIARYEAEQRKALADMDTFRQTTMDAEGEE